MNEEPEVFYEPLPVVTELSGDEEQADMATFEAACSLLRLYTSQAYIAQAATLFCGVLDAFEAWPRARQRLGEQTLLEWMAKLQEQRAAYESGLTLLAAGHVTAAYAAIGVAAHGMEPDDPRNERHFSLRLLAEELGRSITTAGETLGVMASRIDTTLSATWSYQTLMADDTCVDQDNAMTVVEHSSVVLSGNTVPRTGIWMPATIRHGCPNFLAAGQAAPLMTRACTRYDYSASDGGGLEPPRPAWSAYDYVTEPTTWRLVWDDTRHRVGHILL